MAYTVFLFWDEKYTKRGRIDRPQIAKSVLLIGKESLNPSN